MLSNLKIGSLIIKLQYSDKKALEELWHLTKEAIYSFILIYIQDKQLAEDVLQETFISVYKCSKGFRRNMNAKAWLFTIARNHAIDLLRKRKKIIQDEEELIAISDDNPYEEAIDTRDEIDKMLESIDETSRRIILMHAVNGLKHREIASILSIPLGTVYRKYSESIKRLRESYKNVYLGGC